MRESLFACSGLLAADSIVIAPELLVGHVQVMQELKAKLAEKNKKIIPIKKTKAMTQTEAHMSVVDISKSWNIGHKINDYKAITQAALAKEKEMHDTHYVFYHAQASQFLVLEDFVKEFYGKLAVMGLSHFHFLRFWYEALASVNAHDFINQNNNIYQGPYQYDTYNVAMKYMICANLSLFGNSAYAGECSFCYFYSNRSCRPGDLYQLFTSFAQHFGIAQKFITSLLALNADLAMQEGLLFQIFIPKDKVDQCVYLAQPGYHPETTIIDNNSYDHKLQRHTKISPILEKYRNSPRSIPNIDTLQVRILFSQDLMLNPESGIEIVRYTTVSDKAMTTYRTKLQKLVREIFAEWLVKGVNSSHAAVKNTPLMNLIRRVNLTVNK